MPLHRAVALIPIALIAVAGCRQQVVEVPAEIVKKAEELGDPLLMAIKENKPDAVALELDRGADPNAPLQGDLPPLHLAATTGAVEVGELLIRRRANIDRQTVRTFLDDAKGEEVERRGEAALHVAITSSKYEFVEMLIREKADIDLKNGRGMTPLDLALSQGRILQRWSGDVSDEEQQLSITADIAANKKIVALLKDHKAKTTEELEAARLKQAVEEDGSGGLLGRINEKMDKRRLQGDGLELPPDLPDIDSARDRDDEVYDLEFNEDVPVDDDEPTKQDEDPDAIPSLFP